MYGAEPRHRLSARDRSRLPGFDGGFAFVRGDVSSQFLSGLLMGMLPNSRALTTVEVQGLARLRIPMSP